MLSMKLVTNQLFIWILAKKYEECVRKLSLKEKELQSLLESKQVEDKLASKLQAHSKELKSKEAIIEQLLAEIALEKEQKSIVDSKLIDEQASEIKCLKESHTVLEDRITELEIELDKKNEITNERDETVKDLTSQLNELQKKFSKAESQKDKAKLEFDDSTLSKFAEFELKIKQLQAKLDEANDSKNIMKKKLKKKQAETESICTEVPTAYLPR